MTKPIPRLEMDQLTPELQTALSAKVKRLGYLGEFFKCMGNQPKALLSFNTFTEDLKQALPDNLTEVVALTVATMMQNRYERNQHERLCVKLGFDKQWVHDVNALAPTQSKLLSDAEQVVQQFAIAVISRRGRRVQPRYNAVIDVVGATRAVALLMLVGRYVTHALIVNTLELAPPVASIFEGNGK